MTFAETIQLVTALAPILSAPVVVAGIAAYFKYRESRPESFAKARQINVTAEISVADAWRLYAQNVELRFKELEKKYDTALKEKDKEIGELRNRVNHLEAELLRYTAVPVNAEKARNTLHATVDESINEIRGPTEGDEPLEDKK